MTPNGEIHKSVEDVFKCRYCEKILDGYDEIIEDRFSRVERLVSELDIEQEADLLRGSAKKYGHLLDLQDAIKRVERTRLSTLKREKLIDLKRFTVDTCARFTDILKSGNIDKKSLSIHLKELIRHDFLIKEDRKYRRGDEYVLTYFNVIRYLKDVHPSMIKWHDGIGYFHTNYIPSDKELEKLRLRISGCCQEIERMWKSALKEEPYSRHGVLIPRMIVVDLSSLHRMSENIARKGV